MPTKNNSNQIERPPVIAVMGHVDHGKSTLLDYIRKSNVVEGEAGGITQRISAYEVVHKTKEGQEKKITFLDTPGHEAFTAIRSRGASVADIAILVVSAEDGVQPQTKEALKIILEAKIPYIVAINKIDREGADVERTKMSLAENEIYVEGYGGDVTFIPISAKTGQGVSELLDLIVLAAELEELKGDTSKSATGMVIEADLDRKKGLSATLIIKDGSIKAGMHVAAGSAISPVRIMENFVGAQIKEASFSSPIRIIGWNELPKVGSSFEIFNTKKEAEAYVQTLKIASVTKNSVKENQSEDIATQPLIIKAGEAGGLEAVLHEVQKITHEKLRLKIISAGVGTIAENDIKLAGALAHTIVLGFNVPVDSQAKGTAEKLGIEIQTFDIIYKLSEWLAEAVLTRAPKSMIEESTGQAKILRLFSKVKDRQVIGGRMETGELTSGAEVKILRRDFEVGKGKVRELQRQKNKAESVPEGQEFGALVESKIEIAPGDRLVAFKIVEK